jgi:crotonobetainyl-CoA:carnitine CoA-transferase CaiB-like acyl-CoA transferase
MPDFSGGAVTLPFEGIRIVSFAEQYPGPYATLLMGDLGADVINVERPVGGDPARRFAGLFEGLNRGKRSCSLDLKNVAGREAAVRLAAEADVFLDGFRPGTLDRLGLGYDAVSSHNPGVVYVSISGYGQDGPYRLRPAHDVSYQATAGVLHEHAQADRALAAPALTVGDLSSGMFGAFAAASGLLMRERTGRGTYIDVSMLDGLVSWATTMLVPVLNGMGPPNFPHEPGYGLFPTADGRVISLSVAHEDSFWAALCEALGLHDVAELPGDQRLARRDELSARIADVIGSESGAHWESVLDARGVAFSPVLTLDEVPQDPQVEARRMLVEIAGSDGRPARRHVRQPLQLDGSAPGPSTHAPTVGEHTREVLLGIGYDAATVAELLASSAAYESPR